MKTIHFNYDFPEGQAGDIFLRFRVFAKTNQHILLRQFLREATLVIRDEVRLLAADQRKIFPPFNTVLDLASLESMRKGPLGGAVELILLVVVELGLFIG
jgi:hypothetical protein